MEPAELEATGVEEVKVEWRGAFYTFPASLDDCDGDVLDAIDAQKMSFALKALLGEDQWETFKTSKPKVRDYGALFTEYAKAIGLPTVPE